MKLLSLIAICFGSLLFAQKIQIKKDKILFNEKEIALIKSPYRDHYEIFTLNNEKSFDVDLKGVALSKEDALHYLELKSSDGKTAQIPYEVLVTSLKSDKIIIHLLAVKYKLFNEKGIDKDELADFFDSPKENLSDKYTQIKANSITDQQQIDKRLSNIRSIYNPRIGSGWEVLFNNGSYPEKIVGYIRASQCNGFSSAPCIEVWDLDNIKVAEMYQTPEVRKYVVRTFDNNRFTYSSSRSYAASDYAFFSEFLSYLILEGYTLEHQAYYKNQSLQNAKIENAVKRSVNLYDVPGFVVEKSGKKTEGLITVWFEQLDTERTGQRLPTDRADVFGQNVQLKTTLPGGGMRSKTFGADMGVYFCINRDGNEECFYGMDVKGELMKKLQNYGSIHGNNSYFYKMIYKDKGIMLLQDPVETHKYVIKTDHQPKGQMIDNRSNEKLSEKLSEYLKGCKKLSEDLTNSNYDLRNEENLVGIVKEFADCRK